MGWLSHLFHTVEHNPIAQALETAASAIYAPYLLPVVAGVNSKINGGNTGDALKNAGIAFGAQELAPVAGNAFSSAFPETASSLGVTGGANSLTDLFGQTTGGGSFAGPGTIGGGLSNLFNDAGNGMANFGNSTGISQFLGGTPQSEANLGTNLTDVANTAPNPDVTAGATNPVNFAHGGASASYLPSAGTGSAGVGGGTLTGFGGDPASIGESSALPSAQTGSIDINPGAMNPSGIGGTPSSGGLSNLFSTPNVATGNYDINGAAAGVSSYSAPEQLTNAISSAITPQTGGNPVTPGTGNMTNGLLRAGLGALFSNNNNKGYNAQITAGNNINSMYQPYVQTGNQANTTLANLFGENGADAGAQAAAQANWQNTPGYQFALDQGLKAVNADAAAKGQLLSGNNQQAVQKFGTGLADQTYNNYVGNLEQQAGQGINAAGGAATGMAGAANAQAGKGGQAANTQNAALGMGLNALFPQSNPFASLMGSGGGNGGMSNMLAALFAGKQPQNAFSYYG